MDAPQNRRDPFCGREKPLSFSAFANPVVILVSLLGAVLVGLTLYGIGYGLSFPFAYISFILFYLMLSVLWGEGEEARVSAPLRRELINPANRVIPLVVGGVLLLLYHLGSDFLMRVLFLDTPLIGADHTGLPPLLFAVGILLVSLPVVTLKPVGLKHEIRVNIAYPLFFTAFTVYLCLEIYSIVWGNRGGLTMDIIDQLLFITFISGMVMVVSEILYLRSRSGSPGKAAGNGD